jgi:MFS family permease
LFGVSSTALSGPLAAAIQTVTPDNSRATAFAVLYLVSNLVGIGVGPLVVGVTSDLLAVSAGEGALHLALIAMTPGFILAAVMAWGASRVIAKDIPNTADGDVAPALHAPASPPA